MEYFAIIVSALSLFAFIAWIAGTWKAFQKAGQPGWAAIVPFYIAYIKMKIGGHSGWWLLLYIPVMIVTALAVVSALGDITSVASAQVPSPMGHSAGGVMGGLPFSVQAFAWLIPLVFLYGQVLNFVRFAFLYDVARSFGKGLGFTLGLQFLFFIFWPILGFSDAEYRGPVAHPNMVDKGSGAHITNNNQAANQQAQQQTADGGDPFME